MNKASEYGRSMLETLSVLALIGILTLAAFFGYQRAITKTKVNQTVETVAMVLQKYADFTLKNVQGIDVSGEEAISYASVIGLADTCPIIESEADGGYQICSVPLGELYLKFQATGTKVYNYMLFLVLVNQDLDVCASFLSQGWEQIIPAEWWPNAMIWLKSDKEEAVAYPQGGQNVTRESVAKACRKACVEDEEYCVVIFDLGGIQ